MLPPIWHGTLREHYLVLFGAAGAIATVSGAVSAWIGAQIGARRAVRDVGEPVPRPVDPLLRERLDMLQQSVDSTAIEVERIAEAQRFAARLLADRASSADAPGRVTPRSALRVPTPH